MNKDQLQNQLEELRRKWKVFPKSYLDKDWCSFRVDKSKALMLKEQIRKIESGEEIKVDDLTEEQAKEIFK